LRIFISCVAVTALAACGDGVRRPTDAEYIAHREHYVRTIASLYGHGDLTALHDSALRDLEAQLRALIGPVAVRGHDKGINIESLYSGDEDSGEADGLAFYDSAAHTSTFVSTPGVFRAWAVSRWGAAASNLDTALGSGSVQTFVLWRDAAVSRYADLPVAAGRRHIAAAFAADRSQDECFTCVPNEIIVAAIVGNHVFVVAQPAHDTIPVPHACTVAARSDPRPKEASDGYRRSPGRPAVLKQQAADSMVFADFRNCYAQSVRSDPRFASLVAQAQALVASIPDR